jgi:hypothetical protein
MISKNILYGFPSKMVQYFEISISVFIPANPPKLPTKNYDKVEFYYYILPQVTKGVNAERSQKMSSPESRTDSFPPYIAPIISGIFTILAATSFAAVFSQPSIQISTISNDFPTIISPILL